MSTVSDLWSSLRTAPDLDVAGGMKMRLRIAATGVRMFAAIDTAKGLPALVVDIPRQVCPDSFQKIRTKAFEAHVGPLAGLPDGRIALALLLRDDTYEDLFSLLGEDLAVTLGASRSETDAVKNITNRIMRWRRFMERGGRRLSEEEVRGLLGELAVLSRCVVQYGPSKAVDGWQGGGGLRDFELGDFAVEVKTHQAAAGATVRISDPAQLEFAQGRPLYLATLHLSRSEQTGWTLAGAVDALAVQLVVDAEAGETFWMKLADQDNIAGQDALYPERYVLGKIHLFHVRDGFPRLASATLPAGVEAVHFSICLAAMQPFAVPADAVLGAESLMEALI